MHATPATRGKPRTRHYHLQHKQFCPVKTSEMCLFLCTHVDNIPVSCMHTMRHLLVHSSAQAPDHHVNVARSVWVWGRLTGLRHLGLPACHSVYCVLNVHRRSCVVVATAVHPRPPDPHEARHDLTLGEERKPLFLDMLSAFED